MSVWTHFIPQRAIGPPQCALHLLLRSGGSKAIDIAAFAAGTCWISVDTWETDFAYGIGLAARYDGTSWTFHTFTGYHTAGPDDVQALRPLFVASDTSVWVATQRFVWHWNGTGGFLSVRTPQSGSQFRNLFGLDDNRVWAQESIEFILAGHYTTYVWKWNGTSWALLPVPSASTTDVMSGGPTLAAWAGDPGEVYSGAGSTGHQRPIRYDWTAPYWATDQLAGMGGNPRPLYMSGPGEVWGVVPLSLPTLLRKTGGVWIVGGGPTNPSGFPDYPSGFEANSWHPAAAHGQGPDDVWFVGSMDIDSGTSIYGPQALHWADGGWAGYVFAADWLATHGYHRAGLTAVWVASQDEIWAAGIAYCNYSPYDFIYQALVLHTTDRGLTWTDVSPPPWFP